MDSLKSHSLRTVLEHASVEELKDIFGGLVYNDLIYIHKTILEVKYEKYEQNVCVLLRKRCRLRNRYCLDSNVKKFFQEYYPDLRDLEKISRKNPTLVIATLLLAKEKIYKIKVVKNDVDFNIQWH